MLNNLYKSIYPHHRKCPLDMFNNILPISDSNMSRNFTSNFCIINDRTKSSYQICLSMNCIYHFQYSYQASNIYYIWCYCIQYSYRNIESIEYIFLFIYRETCCLDITRKWCTYLLVIENNLQYILNSWCCCKLSNYLSNLCKIKFKCQRKFPMDNLSILSTPDLRT